MPAVALKTALVLKPGSAEPWTPYRIVQAFLQRGRARGRLRLPTRRATAPPPRSCGAAGAACSSATWAPSAPGRSDPRVELHGPGYSKVLLGPDAADGWERYLDVMLASVLENSGRSCVNASGIWTTAHGDAIAEALARSAWRRCSRATPRTRRRSSPPSPTRGWRSASRSRGRRPARAGRARGHGRATARAAASGRPATAARTSCPRSCACDSAEHPLANREFLFPFASVVEVRPEELPGVLGPTLALTAITEDAALRRRLLAAPLVHRLNLGAVPTMKVSWDQPHEGNLFEHLYARRALQRAAAVRHGLIVTAGAGGMYCGSCLRDNALAAELIARGARRLAAPRLHADPAPTSRTSAASACSSAASASTCSSTCRSSGTRPTCWTGSGTARRSSARSPAAGCRPIRSCWAS